MKKPKDKKETKKAKLIAKRMEAAKALHGIWKDLPDAVMKELMKKTY